MSRQGNHLHFVPDGARELAERRRWQAEKLLHAALAPIGGARPVFARVLERALAQARRGEAGFWLPMAFAVQRFGSRLELSVPTAAIEQVVLDGVAVGGRRLHTGQWFIGAGDWSPILWPIGRHQVSQEAAELLAQDLCFRDTTVYRHYRLRAEGGRPMVRNRVALDSVERIDAYFERFVALFRSIRAQGVLRRGNLPGRARQGGGQRSWWTELGEQDIGVALDATGRLSKLPGGQHRFAIARALGLEAVPVQVRLLHVDALQGRSAAELVSLVEIGRLCELCNAR